MSESATCCGRAYYCPTAGESECGEHGGFTVCCSHPDLHQPLVERLCPKARKKGRGSKRPRVEHGPHDWIAGVYYPVGDVDGYPARCPGWSP